MTATVAETAEAEAPETPAKSRRKLVIVAAVLVVLVAVGGFFLLGGKGSDSKPAPKPGQVLQLEPVSMNLADGRYLKVTLALQLTADVKEAPDGAKALDAAVSQLSLRRVSEMSTPAQRAEVKQHLAKTIEDRYDGEVMDVYITEFITQ